ncbi:hypothetical protein GCM10020219_072270 [Nonomuraea dietziae]
MSRSQGVAGLAGGQLGGRAADRWGADRALLVGVTAFTVVMAAFVACWLLRPLPLLGLLPLLLVWGRRLVVDPAAPPQAAPAGAGGRGVTSGARAQQQRRVRGGVGRARPGRAC